MGDKNEVPLDIKELPFEVSLTSWRLKRGHRTYIPKDYIELDYDDSDWMEVPVGLHLQQIIHPNDYWKDEVKLLNYYPWWYRTKFILPETYRNHLIRVKFEGVDYYASVWVNGHFLGHHEGSFAPFEYDITKIALYGEENLISVKVEAPWDIPFVTATTSIGRLYRINRNMVKGMYEHADGLFPPYTNPIGIWRPVKLRISGPLTIDRVNVTTQFSDENEVELTLKLTLTNHLDIPKTAGIKILIEGETFEETLIEKEMTKTLQPGVQEITCTYRVKEPRFWWPWDQGTPDLYRATVILISDGEVSDERTEVFGIREVTLVRSSKEMYFTLNRRKIFIRGSTYIPDIYLSRMSYESYKKDMELVKEANLNLIRLHVHVERPELYDLCDQMGIMIYQDFELNWSHPSTQEFEERALKVFREMIYMLWNHPSIIVWCCHNEPTKINYYEHPDQRLFEEAMKLDPTRPVIKGSGRKEDYICSGDSHTYYGSLDPKASEYSMVYNNRELLNTEYGVDAPPCLDSLRREPRVYERFPSYLHNKIEELQDYQSELVKYYTEHYRRTKYNPCGGYIHFMFVDCAPTTFYGVLDYYRVKKKAYEVLKNSSNPVLICFEYYRDEPNSIWIINDLHKRLENCKAEWKVVDSDGNMILNGNTIINVEKDSAMRITNLTWKVKKNMKYDVYLVLRDQNGKILSKNHYHNPLHQTPRPKGYPEAMEPYHGMRIWSE